MSELENQARVIRLRQMMQAEDLAIMSFEEMHGLSGLIILLIGAATVLWDANQ